MVDKAIKQKNIEKGIKGMKDNERIYNVVIFLLLHN